MVSIVNASPTNGIVQTADGSGVMKIQSNGKTTNSLAWVNFTGSTAVIKSAYNVSSVTRNAAGDFTLNFTTALSDTNYAVAGSIDNSSAGANAFRPNSWNTTTLQFYTQIPGTGAIDCANTSVIIFGN